MQSNTAISNQSTILKLFKWLTGSFYSSCISLLHSDLTESAYFLFPRRSGPVWQTVARIGGGGGDKEEEEIRDTKMHM